MSMSIENESLLAVSNRKPILKNATGAVSPGFVRWFLVPAALLLAAVAALNFDLPLAKRCYGRDYPGFVRHILSNAEPFGDAYGLLLIVAGVFLFDTGRRKLLPWIIAAGLGSGLTADVIKLFISRTRPQSFDLKIHYVAETFGPWLPLSKTGSHNESFPSAHTAVAMGFAVALCQFYPRGRVLFIAMAVMCAMQRVQTCAHFLSDTLTGAAVGWLVSHAILAWYQNSLNGSKNQLPSTAGA